MRHTLDTDYLVVGAGASGLAFTDALIDHADVQVVVVDRRHGPGGHWLDAYPFVRLHQSSIFYGVASTQLGDGSIQPDGPEAGLQERATAPEICAYYVRVMERLLRSGKVTFLSGCDYLGEGRVRSRVSGHEHQIRVRRRVVNAHYLEPLIPATTPAPFAAEPGMRDPGPSDGLPRCHAGTVRHRGFGQDRHRRLRLAARKWRRSRRDLLDPSPRAVDVQPRRGPAGPGCLHRPGRRLRRGRPGRQVGG